MRRKISFFSAKVSEASHVRILQSKDTKVEKGANVTYQSQWVGRW